MVYKVYSGAVGGVFGDLITVEVDASPGLPSFEIIGLPGSEVKEAKDRVRVALKNAGVDLPAMKIVVNLSPADERKGGSGFDLPIAIAILGVFGYVSHENTDSSLILGELSLDGKIASTRGVLPIVLMAREKGFKRVILPIDNVKEGALIRGIDVIPADSLAEIMTYLKVPSEYAGDIISPYSTNDLEQYLTKDEYVPDFNEVYGQENVKRAVAIAAAGFHHILLSGPPGTGKSLIAKRIPGIMPPLTYEESLEVTSVYSVAGKLTNELPFIKARPFWSPHHGASAQSIIGGGSMARPGLVSLSHRGILFLDEMPEFKRETLEMLRQPLEDGKITIARAKNTYSYPAGFMLVGAMNPCPCGFFPDRNRCSCSEIQIQRYLSKISGPILDRIDICIEVNRMNPNELQDSKQTCYDSDTLRSGVLKAVEIQKKRYANESFSFNSNLPSSLTDKYIPLSEKDRAFAYSIYESMKLSMRSFYKLLRVARTIADFDGDENVETKHLAEASCYRFPEYINS